MNYLENRNTAVVLEIGDRFFSGFCKDGRIQTAWSLAGARLFGVWRDDDISAVERKLHTKGKQSYRRNVSIVL